METLAHSGFFPRFFDANLLLFESVFLICVKVSADVRVVHLHAGDATALEKSWKRLGFRKCLTLVFRRAVPPETGGRPPRSSLFSQESL